MKNEEKGPELDRAIDEIRREALDPQAVTEAAGRVWARLNSESAAGAATGIEAIRSCADFQALIPEWRGRRLPAARALLVEDHVHECPACRKVAMMVRPPAAIRPKQHAFPVWRWAIAASVVAAAAGLIYYSAERLMTPSGPRATVYAASGTLYRSAGAATAALNPGAPLAEGERVQTAKGARAVLRLRDGSLVEMRERTEVAVSEARAGATIRLTAGNIIVQAAKQRSKHLFVATDDCKVSVTGTVFSVNHGIKGSRVAVIEGEVQVTQGDDTKVLHPGEQTTTTQALTPVPLDEEVAWSQDAEKYAALLSELGKFQRRLEAIPGQALRTSTRLLDLAPEGTTFYAAVPNVGPMLGEAEKIFQEQLNESAALRDWWTSKMSSPDARQKLDETLARVQAFSSYLGPEIALAVVTDPAGQNARPVVMAEVVRSGLKEYIQQQVPAEASQKVQVVSDVRELSPGGDGAFVWVGQNLAAASVDAALVQSVAAAAASGASPFTRSPFHARVADAYKDGVGWLFSADLGSVIARGRHGDATALDRSGVADVRYLVVQRKQLAGETENRAVVTFAQARRGIASWLAAPAPMRALDYVSPDAQFAAAAVMKNPAALLDDLAGMAPGAPGEFLRGISEFQTKTGVNVRDDLAAPLGGELAFAFDGPAVPVPSWKLAIEVYDPARFQHAIERLVETATTEIAGKGDGALEFRRDDVNGRTFYSLRTSKAPFEAVYTFDNGFLVAASSRELVLRSIELRATGYSLAKSQKFVSMLPRDGQTGLSAVVYQSLGGLLGPLAAQFGTEQQRKAVQAAAGSPSLVAIYGQQDRIEVASVGTFFGLRLEQMLGLGRGGPRGAGARKRGS